MTKKLINIKNLLRIVISLMVIFSMARSCAKAYTFEQLLEYCSVLRTYDGASNDQKNLANWVLNNQNTIRSSIGNDINDFDSWQIDKMTYSRGGTRIMGYQGGAFNGWNQACVVKNYTKGIAITQADGYFRTTRATNLSSNLNYMSKNSYCGLLAQNIAENVNFTGKLWNNIYNPLRPLEFDNFLDNSAYNGNLWTYYFQGDFYSYNRFKIGNIITNDSYYFEARLRDSQTNIVLGTSFVALNTEPYTFYNDGALYINNNFEVYVITRNLSYSTQYQIEITSYYGDGDTDLDEDIDWFIFLPQNAVIENDTITSLGSGDFTTQDSTNQIIENQQQQQDDLLNMSGDSALVVLPSYNFSGDQSENFFNFILDSIEEVFLSEDEASLSLPIYGEEIVINSTDFDVLPSSFKIFIGGYHWFWVGLMILKDVRKIFENLKNGDFEKIASDDINANLI